MSRSDAQPVGPARQDASGAGASRHPSVSLRWRLTLLIIAVFAVIQVTITVARLLAVRKAIDSAYATQVDGVLQDIALRLSVGGTLARDEATMRRVDESAERLSDYIFVQNAFLTLYERTDSVDVPLKEIARSDYAPSGLESGADAAMETDDFVHSSERVRDDGVRNRYVSRRFAASDGRQFVLFSLTNAPAIDFEIAQADRAFIISTPIGILAAAIGAWYVAGVAVEPLNRLRQIAQRLRPESIGESINIQSSASEVTRLQDDLNAARKRLDEGYQAQERFIANVSHEIKTPIAVILTEAQTLRGHTDVPPDVRAFISSAEDEMRRLGQLVESFLLLARVREGQGIFTVSKPYAVNELVMESLEHCGRMAEQQHVAVLPRLIDPDAAEVTVNGDPALLRTVIDNLIRNALRFSPAGERVEVDLSADAGVVQIVVRDFGPGIPPDVLAHIFDRFSSVKSEQRLGRGSGLGLEIAKGIAEIHGGDITAMNHPDGGCVFTLTLPALISAPASDDSTAQPVAH